MDVTESNDSFGTIQSMIPTSTHQTSLLRSPMVLVSLLTLGFLVFIRFTSGKQSVQKDGARTVPALPYWIPGLGHLPNMGVMPASFLNGARSFYTNGIFALNFGGTTHNVVYTPSLATALLNQKASNADAEQVSNNMVKSIFGFPSSEQQSYDKALPDIMTCYKQILTEPSLGDMVGQTASSLRENVKTLVGFVESLVDQTWWERSSNLRLKVDRKGDQVVEASLLPLVRSFIAHTANPSLIGTNFLNNFPNFFEDLWTLDRGFLYLATGLPRWVPIPALTRAHIARHKLLAATEAFHDAMEKEANGEDPGPEWQDLDDVGALIKARVPVYRKYGFSIKARAALEHALLWAMNANANPLVFWMINRIYADKALLAMIREEIAPYVRAVQPKQDFPIPQPPHIESFDVEGLCTNCPLLKSCYIECLRLDTASWSLKVVKQDLVLQGRERNSQGWLLRKGEYAHAAHDLHNTDPNYFDDPMVWKPDRHVKYGDDEKGTADMGSIRPYGGGSSMCKGRAFAFKECMMFTAAIVALWEIEPAGGGQWKMPRHRKATGVYGTSDDTRVWIKRRVLPQAS